MTLAAEVQELDGEGRVQPLARLVVTGKAEPAVVELAPGGSAIAATLLDPALRDPEGRSVGPADGAEYLRVLRYAKSSDRLWVTPLAELPEQEALDPATPFPDLAEPYVPATLPYPTPPVELDGVRMVEVVKPREDDLLKLEVASRVVSEPEAGAFQEPREDPDVAGRIRALAAEGADPLAGLVAQPIGPGLAARWARFERPFDRAARDGAVAAYRAASAAGEERALRRIRAEYLTRLPRIWVSRCPFTGEVLRLAVDAFGFDGPWFDPLDPLRPLDPDPPATFLAFTGEVPVGAGTAWVEAGWTPSRLLVRTDLLGDARVRGVVSWLHVGRTAVWNVAYFAETPAPELPLAADWGSAVARVRSADGSWGFEEAPLSTAIDFDLAPWLESGKLQWIKPFDSGVTLEQGLEGFPR